MQHGRHSALHQLEQKGVQVGMHVCCCCHVNMMCLNYDLKEMKTEYILCDEGTKRPDSCIYE